jgi:hypothetical protein
VLSATTAGSKTKEYFPSEMIIRSSATNDQLKMIN